MNFERANITKRIKTCDMHTGGHPFRIVTDGGPILEGRNLLEKRDYARDHADCVRRLLMSEPRGHNEMYGGILTKPDNPSDSDLAVLFINTEGYSTMCGHGVIALSRYALDMGFVETRDPETEVRIQCPCGLVRAFIETKTGNVRFHSVPAFVAAEDVPVVLPGIGEIKVDIAFGGGFYAILPASLVNLDVHSSKISELTQVAITITDILKKTVKLQHPTSPKLAFLFGTILTDDATGPTTNICVYGDGSVDRSPTGSGVTARVALGYKKHLLKLGEERIYKSVAYSCFTGSALTETKCGDYDAVIVQVSGKAHYMGEQTFILEEDDPFQEGFLLRK